MKQLKKLAILCLLLAPEAIHAQEEMLYTQYFFSELVVNPAYAGNDDGLNLTALSRKQWIGLSGSPETFSFIGHTLFAGNPECRGYSSGANKNKLEQLHNNQVGLGLVLFDDKIGVNNTFLASMSYSYKILFSSEKRLSFGLQATVLNFQQQFSQLSNLNQFDQVFQNNFQALRFNAGTGVFYETDRYYMGLSVPEIIKNNLDHRGSPAGEKQLRQYFFSGGYVFYLNRLFKFKPTILMRYTEGMPMQFDINANILYMEKVWMGVSYRYNSSVNAIMEILVSDKFKVGFAYDYVTTELNRVSHGSIEIMASYSLKNSKKRIASPRYF